MSHIKSLWREEGQTDKNAHHECCGCSACANKCPTKAISMKYDREGFLYPVVDEDVCVNCEACAKVCPIMNAWDIENPYIETYAGYSLDDSILMNCTSGGFVTALSMKVIENGGVVSGVRYRSDYIKSEYYIARKKEEVLGFSGSKYVQSEKSDVYRQVEQELKQNKQVLFVGCPCDVHAMKLYLGKLYGTFLSCELVCMGVSSYRIAEDYKAYAEKKNKSELTRINARSKRKGWFVPHLEEQYCNGQIKCSTLFGTFLGYGMQVYNRPSCFVCKYRGINGVGDIRVGDFWGIKSSDPYWNPKGVSCIFVRTENGLNALTMLDPAEFALFETDYDLATLGNISAYRNKPDKYVQRREKFADVFERKGLIPACRATGTISFWVKHLVPDCFHSSMKKLYHFFIDKR